MSDIQTASSSKSIEEEAAEWVIRIDESDLSDGERNALNHWLKNPSHEKVFVDFARVWGDLDVLRQVAELVPKETCHINERINEVRLSKTSEPIRNEAKTVQLNKRSIRQSYWAAAAAISIISLLLLMQFLQYEPKISRDTITSLYETKIGEQRDITLADGSQIKLNTNSVIKVELSATQRAIHLMQGEANFIVAKDKARPFIVYVGKGSVTAVGTEFNVKFERGVADVLVTEGVVKVSATATPEATNGNPLKIPQNASRALVASVIAGQKAQISAEKISDVHEIEHSNIERELSWHSGMLSFADTPLREVITEVSRYTSLHIVINDPEIANIPVGGYFKASETNAMLEVLQLSFGVKVTRAGNNVVLSKSERFVDQ